jgi:hypothetical protein
MYFVTRRKGLIFDTKYWLEYKGVEYNIDLTEDAEIKHKIINRIVQLEKLDTPAMRSLISFANRELPDKDIYRYILPLIASAIQTALTTEMGIQYTLKTTLTKQLNFFKTSTDIDIAKMNEKSVFTRIYNWLHHTWGAIVDYFSSNVDIDKASLDPKQFNPAEFKPQYFQ